MASASREQFQDMPPKGGYDSIRIDRLKVKPLFGSPFYLAFYLGSTVVGFYTFYQTYKKVQREKVEMRSARFAILPMLLAERDRMVLKQMRRNRDEEAELMKDYPGWVVGTYFGEKIFNTDEDDTYHEPLSFEHFAHSNPLHILYRAYYRHFF